MTLNELNAFFNSFLKNEDFDKDISLNGVQVQNSAPDSKEIKKVAFAVDACLETIKRAAQANAGLLFAHHGIFWGKPEAIDGSHGMRVKSLIRNNMGLISYHIPLDANNPYGNNYGLAARLELKECQPFGSWRGMTIGVKGVLPAELTIDKIAQKLLRPGKKPSSIIALGKKNIKTVGIISGGASEDVADAIDEKLDNVKDKIHSETIPNAMDWLKNHGHTDSEIVDFLAHIKNGKI